MYYVFVVVVCCVRIIISTLHVIQFQFYCINKICSTYKFSIMLCDSCCCGSGCTALYMDLHSTCMLIRTM